MPSSTENVKLGPCRITFNGVDLGYTKGGVEVEVETSTHEVNVDQFGETNIAEYITGRNCMVSAPLAETTLENLVAIMPGATLVTDGVDPAIMKVEVTPNVGVDLLSIAAELSLHPSALPESDKSQDFTLPKTATPGAISYAYKLDEERIFNVTFKAYPDTANGDVLFIVGDPAATA